MNNGAGLASRAIAAELLDSASPSDKAANLRDLARINRWLGGHAILRTIGSEILEREGAATVLDVGAAGGDMGRVLRANFPGVTVFSLDLAPSHLAAAAAPRVAADAFRLPFPPRTFDVVMCSLFLHHFDDGQAVELLRAFRPLARRAVLVMDLERHRLAHRFVPATRRLFGWHPVTVHDAPVSVAAGFRLEELSALARRAGYRRPNVRRHIPWFRLSLLERIDGYS